MGASRAVDDARAKLAARAIPVGAMFHLWTRGDLDVDPGAGVSEVALYVTPDGRPCTARFGRGGLLDTRDGWL